MSHAKVIGFSGKMGSGKSTAGLLAGQHLSHKTQEEWYIVAFADALKHLAADIYHVPFLLFYSEAGKSVIPPGGPLRIREGDLPIPMADWASLDRINEKMESSEVEAGHRNTLGKILQILGQLFRDEEPDYWIRALEHSIDVCKNYIVEDVRYPNEFEWIRDCRRGVVGRVVRPSSRATYSQGRDQKHASETALDSCTAWHFVISDEPNFDESGLLIQIAEKLAKFI